MPAIINNGNVSLIDPNMVNVNVDMTNSIPQYQDMYIFAELTAKRKKRTVLSAGGSSSDKDVVINFLGNNQDNTHQNPNYLNFTTNWYDGSIGDRTQYEGFGITSIKVVINSSYVPQINIQFVDIRGLAFFNQTNSPYRILFDFPPPIFNLTIKGYYGMALQYKLHLVKYTSEFKSENGNFVIDAQFIAQTFAPLTDVLFRYVVNFPLMANDLSVNPDSTTAPTSTYEMILKVKNLLAAQADFKQSPDVKSYDDLLDNIKNNTNTLLVLNEYADNVPLNEIAKPVLLIKNEKYVDNNTDEITTINLPSDYDSNIINAETNGIIQNPTSKLWIALPISENVENINIAYGTTNLTIGAKSTKAIDALAIYSAGLINEANIGTFIVSNTDITAPSKYTNNPKNSTQDTTTNLYVYIDITNYYIKLIKQKNELATSKTEKLKTLNTEVNNVTHKTLGMKPTIYNIFQIILNDVDKFFATLNYTAINAQNHHTAYYNQIKNNFGFKDTELNNNGIYAFPLVTKTQYVCGQPSETRIVPIDLSNLLPKPFPEIDLVKNFIDSFYKQRNIAQALNMRSEQNSDGSFKWIPISPVDSKLASAVVTTPYFGLDNGNGGSESQAINTTNGNRLKQVLDVILTRFYVLSQATYPDIFYSLKDDYIALVDMYAQSEAVNLVASVFNSDYINLLKTYAAQYSQQSFYNGTSSQDFYTTVLSVELSDLYGNDTHQMFDKPNSTYPSYVDKTNPNYQGFILHSNDITIRPETTDTSNPVDSFLQTTTGIWRNTILGIPATKFSTENLTYIDDVPTKSSFDLFTSSPDTKTATRFINYANAFSDSGYVTHSLEKLFNQTKIQFCSNLKNSGGNSMLASKMILDPGNGKALSFYGDISDIWANQLSTINTKIKGILMGETILPTYNSELSALLMLSNFGYSYSPFNKGPYDLNTNIFYMPTMIQVPTFFPAYVGMLVDITPEFYNVILNFFNGDVGSGIDSGGYFIFADIYDVNKYLSVKDKASFKASYNSFIVNNFKTITQSLQTLIPSIDGSADKSAKAYLSALNDGNYYKNILGILMERVVLINFSQITFRMKSDIVPTYTSIQTINKAQSKKTVNNRFFTTFFNKLNSELVSRIIDLNKAEKDFNTVTGDEDIMTQCYYSFKNINDKWLTDNKQDTIIPPTGHLIDSFVFVDRAMRPIGDTVINPEILVNMLDDQNISIYTVLSQILSTNGFEFFPLQNFMSYSTDDWEKSFKIDTTNSVQNNPTFVCMYIGGSSSYPTGIDSDGQYKDDGILDISNSGSPDFSSTNTSGCTVDGDAQLMNNNINNFQYNTVRAFRVKFGEQNQSMFSNMKIDSKEYPETNESIQILSRIAGDNKMQAPPPKGQNLYNLYENRAYKATVSGLGNVMIQPTQYFQLEHIQLFNGAYLITSVEHNIEANKMTTNFSGTKILKYPVPRVLESSAIFGFEGGNTSDTNSNMSSNDNITSGSNIIANQPNTQYNSLYDFKIQ